MDKEKYLDDLKDIKDIMERSSKFISLSGLSGIVAGIIACLAAYFVYSTLYTHQDFSNYRSVELSSGILFKVILIAVITLMLAIGSAIFLTAKKARKSGQKIWDIQSKRLVINMAIPLITGGILCLLLLLNGYLGLVAPLTLIFYGLALVNASKYTLSEIRSLGLIEIVIGLFATYFIGYGLLFWTLGFGVLHIIYGIIMQIKYGS